MTEQAKPKPKIIAGLMRIIEEPVSRIIDAVLNNEENLYYAASRAFATLSERVKFTFYKPAYFWVKNLVRVACYASDKDWNCSVENSTIGTFKATIKIHAEGKETYIVPQEEFIADARAVYIQKSKVDGDRMVVEVWL